MRNAPSFLAPLLRNRTLAALLVGELAVLLAIGENVWSLGRDYTSRLLTRSGLTEQGLVVVETDGHSAAHSPQESQERVARLRQVPSVRAAAAVNTIPFYDSSWGSNLSAGKDKADLEVSMYWGDGDLNAVLGLHMVAGRPFEHGDFVANKGWLDEPQPQGVLLSRLLAERMFGSPAAALGMSVYRGGKGSYTVIGVYELLIVPSPQANQDSKMSMVLPMSPPLNAQELFLLRTDRSDIGALRHDVEAALAGLERPSAITSVQSFQELRARHFATERFSLWVLTATGLAVLLVTLAGTYNTLAFWFAQRSPSLVILRALGVSERTLHWELQLEILLIAGIAIAIGAPLAYGVNLLLMEYLESKPLVLGTLLEATLLPLVVGQVAAYFVGRKLRGIALTRPQAAVL